MGWFLVIVVQKLYQLDYYGRIFKLFVNCLYLGNKLLHVENLISTSHNDDAFDRMRKLK